MLRIARSLNLRDSVTLGERFSDPVVKQRVEQVLGSFEVRHRRWFSDGGVLLEGEISLALVLAQLETNPAAGSTAERTLTPSASSFLLDATGLSVTPVLQPRILGAAGEILFDGAAALSGEAGRFPFHYVSDMAEAKRQPGVGSHAPVFRVISSQGSDLILSAQDAKKWGSTELVRRGGGVVVAVLPH